MNRTLQVKLPPSQAGHPPSILEEIASQLHIEPSGISGYQILRKSLDARSSHPHYLLTLEICLGEPCPPRQEYHPGYQDVSNAKTQVLIVGAGPSGLFAALRLLEAGIRPVVLERGKEIKDRRRDLATLSREGILNPDSNYCFGEGGAGTYSDGKLFTRAIKRGDVNRILSIFRHFGAGEEILYEAHPHIGTNKLPAIISAMTRTIREAGGSVYFNSGIAEFKIQQGRLRGVQTHSGDFFEGDRLLLCTGHSARDIFRMLDSAGIRILPKPFALGVRVEHPQALIDQALYHCPVRGSGMPPASYTLSQQLSDRSAFSFCMCPGGIIAPASTSPEELVVNGWSPSKRDNPFANSGVVVQVGEKDWVDHSSQGALAGMFYQQEVEKQAYLAGGGQFVAPAQRMTDFAEGKLSSSLPACSYLRGLRSVDLSTILPRPVSASLREAFRTFGRKIRGFYTGEAVVVAPETRTSSPVRIPRDPATLEHPEVEGLYPCGEGAGYAGGIVSAAMDGEKCAEAIIRKTGT